MQSAVLSAFVFCVIKALDARGNAERRVIFVTV
jgi:hypothetical protein